MSCIILRVGAAEKPNVQKVKAGPCHSALESARRGTVVTVSEYLAQDPSVQSRFSSESWALGTKRGKTSLASQWLGTFEVTEVTGPGFPPPPLQRIPTKYGWRCPTLIPAPKFWTPSSWGPLQIKKQCIVRSEARLN